MKAVLDLTITIALLMASGYGAKELLFEAQALTVKLLKNNGVSH